MSGIILNAVDQLIRDKRGAKSVSQTCGKIVGLFHAAANQIQAKQVVMNALLIVN